MYQRFYKLNAAGNPIAQVLSLLLFGAVLIGAVIMGAFILSALLGVAAIAAAVFAVRIWWFRRKLRQAAERQEHLRDAGRYDGRLIDAEYTVVRERAARRRRRF
jgi:hypothetical protein